jgi:cell division septation protein DedD
MRFRYLAALAWLAALSTPLNAQSVSAGADAWAKGDYDTAVDNWRPLAEKGDPDAQFNLGQAFRWGRGVPANLAAAQTWYERAAGQGQMDAQVILGLMLFQNGDHAAGLHWLKAASEKGEPRAMLVYGTALYNGDGVPQDAVLGYAYVSRAAAQGLQAAKDTLAQLDKILPLEDRRKGVAIAMAKAKAAPAPSSKASETKPVKQAAAKASKATAPLVAAAKPAPKPVAAAPAGGATGSWRIQLGAFSQRSSAEALFRKLSGTLPGRQAYYTAVGNVIRLQAGPFESKAAAAAACRAVGQACFPVPGK